MDKYIIILLENDEFERLKSGVGKLILGFHCENERIAFSVYMKNIKFIIINHDANLTPDEEKIVINHELAHLEGITDEEQADRWAMEKLNDKQKQILIDNWKFRHGKEYE